MSLYLFLLLMAVLAGMT